MRPLHCSQIAQRLHEREEGRLSGTEASALSEHLLNCAACREQAAVFDWAADRLGQGRTPAPGFSDRVMGRLSALRPQPAAADTTRRSNVWFWVPAAAAAVLALTLGLSRLEWRRQPAHVADAPRVEVELGLTDLKARSVAAAGDFNDWQTVQMKKGADGVWKVRLSLQPGRYQYSFVVDGEKWIADPRATTLVSSGYGGQNSVLDISL